MTALDLKGQRFGLLTAVRPVPSKRNEIQWECRCECGKTYVARGYRLRSGRTSHCGCKRSAPAGSSPWVKHGHARSSRRTPEYEAWRDMRQRCFNPNDNRWGTYGARGITVCPEWNDYERFLSDMGQRPGKGYSLDRIDVDGDYCPTNCRWSTRLEQANNTTKTRWVELNGRRLSLADACRTYGVTYSTARSRLRRGLPPEQAFCLA